MASEAIVHVIDDDEAVRDSLAFLLRSARLDVCTYDSATAFLAALPVAGTGCIVTDVRTPALSGIDLLRRLRDRGIMMPVIVMTGHGDVPLAVEAMKIGAADFFEKPFDDDALIAAVRAALGSYEKAARGETERAEAQERLATLTGRERDVLGGLIAGKPNKIIAFDLGISPRTVEIYRANLMNKMQAGSLSDLVRMALIVGMVGSG
jgi:two-component system, LuxR family, response regulator FixJ